MTRPLPFLAKYRKGKEESHLQGYDGRGLRACAGFGLWRSRSEGGFSNLYYFHRVLKNFMEASVYCI